MIRPLRTVLLCVLALLPALVRGQAYTTIVVFGDSLSDTGNVARLSQNKYGVAARVPGPLANYTDGRFTDGTDTVAPARNYTGVWIEQLAAMYAAKPAVKASLDGGTNYAYGSATTANGTTVVSYGTGSVFSVTVNNMGQQVTDYLATSPTITGSTLFVVWGGGNDLLNATSAADVTAAASREVALVQRLITAGATNFVVPNLAPLGAIPRLNMSSASAAAATQASRAFNQALVVGLAALQPANPTKVLRIQVLDVDAVYSSVLASPAGLGLTNATASAQGNVAVNPDTYLFWDDLHPTTAGHHLIALAGLSLTGATAATNTVITSSNLNANLGGAITFTAAVTTTGNTLPSGTLTFLDGATVLGTATPTATGAAYTAAATLTTSTLSAGSHNITAQFAGTNGFSSSTSAALVETVTAPAVQTSVLPSSITVARGASGTATLSFAPVGGFSSTVSLACGTLPAHLSCAFAPATLTFTGAATAQTSTLTVGTTATAALRGFPLPGSEGGLLLAGAGLGGVALFGLRRRLARGATGLLCALFAGAVLLTFAGCAGGADNKAAAGTYTVPVNVTASGATTTVNVTVTVQ